MAARHATNVTTAWKFMTTDWPDDHLSELLQIAETASDLEMWTEVSIEVWRALFAQEIPALVNEILRRRANENVADQFLVRNKPVDHQDEWIQLSLELPDEH
jgi:hypothetical protein